MIEIVLVAALNTEPVTIHGPVRKGLALRHAIHKGYALARWFCLKTTPFVVYAGHVAQIASYLKK
jgi:hypothetical protein